MQIIAAARIAPINAPATIPPSESGKKKKDYLTFLTVVVAKSHGNLVQKPLAERRDWIQRTLSRRMTKDSLGK